MTNLEFILCITVALIAFLGFALTLAVIAIGSKPTKNAALKLFGFLAKQLGRFLD